MPAIAKPSRLSWGLIVAIGVVLVAGAAWVIVPRIVFVIGYEARRHYWAQKVDAEVPLGAPRRDVDAWVVSTLGQNGHLPFGYSVNNAAERTESFVAETLQAKGFRYPCTAWQVWVTLDFNDANRLESRTIEPRGACV